MITRSRFLIAVSAVLLCCGCGSERPGTAAVPLGEAELAVRAMDARVEGTPQQRADGLFLDYVHSQSALVDCFRTYGAIYQPPPFGAPEKAAGPAVLTAPLPVAMSVYLDEETAKIDQAISQAQEAVESPTSPDLRTEKFAEAAAACSPTTGSQARYQTAANDAWIELLGRAGAAPGASIADSDYVACMKEQGVDAASVEDAYGPYPELNALPKSPDSARTAALKRASADVGCRRAAHLAFVDAAAGELSEFQSAHAQEIANAEAMWRQISRDADRARTSWYASHPELPRR